MRTRQDQTRGFVATILKNHKSLTEREVKAAVMKNNGGKLINARVIREVRRKLGIDRPRAVAWARQLLVKTPRLEARKVIAEVSERFGIRLGPPDVTRLRPVGARQRRTSSARPSDAPAKHRRAASVVHVTYHAKGHSDDIALFFRTLAR
jgi:hypothetical protein